jgi:hypothetical protein
VRRTCFDGIDSVWLPILLSGFPLPIGCDALFREIFLEVKEKIMNAKGKTLTVITIILSILLSACGSSIRMDAQPAGNAPAQPETAAQSEQPIEGERAGDEIPHEAESDTSHTHETEIDLAHLPVGDGNVSNQPVVGSVWSCQQTFNGSGAFASGDWMNGDGTFDLTAKPSVDGSVTWPASFTISLQADSRIISGNDLPDHATGNYPVSPGDDAYQYDRNPNSIRAQDFEYVLPANPILAALPSCLPMGTIGVMLTGSYIFNSLDAAGRDAVAHELQDDCQGHPQQNGAYHYHSMTDCIDDEGAGHSSLVGYALDGFGIFGVRGENGAPLTNADLDACHGHTHEIEWDGQMVEMYHYHMTYEYPYTIGCFRGEAPQSGGQGGSAQGGSPQNGGQPSGNDNQPPVDTPLQGGQPPQEAINACLGLSQNAVCTVDTPNGTIAGSCLSVPSGQLACVPAGGSP